MPVVTIVAKSWDFHVTEVLKVSLDENLKMVSETVKYLKSKEERLFSMQNIFLMATRITQDMH
jgi:2-isopropylmalate synthase